MAWRLVLVIMLAALAVSEPAQAQFSPAVYVAAPGGGGLPGGPFTFKCAAHGNTNAINMATNLSGTGANQDCTGANFFVCEISRYTGAGSLSAAQDTSSNTYTQVGAEQASSSSTGVSLWRSFGASTSATFHWSDNGTASFATISCAGFSDGSTSAEDTTYTHAAANSPGAITPTGTNRLMVAGFVTGDPDSGTPTISAGGYTILGPQPQTAGQFEGGALAYKIQTSAVSDNPTFATSGGATGASLQQAFR